MPDPRNLIIAACLPLLLAGAVAGAQMRSAHKQEIAAVQAGAKLDVAEVTHAYELRDRDREIAVLTAQLEQARKAAAIEARLIENARTIERIRDDIIDAAQTNPDLNAPIDPAFHRTLIDAWDRLYGDAEAAAGADLRAGDAEAGDPGVSEGGADDSR